MRRVAGLTVILALSCAAWTGQAQASPKDGLASSATPKSGDKTGEVTRGTFRVLVHVRGTVVAEDVFRLKSTIEGRVEAVLTSSRTWAKPGQSLGFLVNTELAALMDSKGTTSNEVLEERWQRVFQPATVRCPMECYVLKVFARPKVWVQPETILVEAASRLRLIGRVRPGDSHWIKDGQLLRYWDRSNHGRKAQARVENFLLDIQGKKVDPGGTFSALLDSQHYLDPGTQWEGVIIAQVKPDALSVPTSSLLFHDGEVFLPVRVSTGITTYDATEIQAGAVEGQKILLLDTARLSPDQRYRPSVDLQKPDNGPGITDEELTEYYRRKPKGTVVAPRVPLKDEDFPSDLE